EPGGSTTSAQCQPAAGRQQVQTGGPASRAGFFQQRSNLAETLLPQPGEGKLQSAMASGLGQGRTLRFVGEVVFQESFQILIAVLHGVLTGSKEAGGFLVAAFLEEEGAGQRGLEGPHVALGTGRTVEHDARTPQQGPVVVAEDTLRDPDTEAVGQASQ